MNMKFILTLAALLLLPFSAQAQTFVTKEKANEYFSNCAAAKSGQQAFVGNGQNIMCACQAARLTQFFYMEDMVAMGNPDPNIARPAYNKMLTEIYAPCMGEPTRAFHFNECMASGKVSQATCACASEALARHMELSGSNIFKQILAQDPNATDPNAILFGSPEFQQLAGQKTIGCLK